MLKWFKRLRVPKSPTIKQTVIGEVQIDSSVLLLADPMCIYDPVRIENLPNGRYAVQAQIIRYPEGGERIAKIGIGIRPGAIEARQMLGTIGVDSAIVVALDGQVHEKFWKLVGSERIGRTSGDHLRVARLIERQFGLKSREVDFLHSVFEEPISEDLEAQITAYLKTFPEYATHTFIYFRIQTKNTVERVFDTKLERPWCDVVLDEGSGASLLAFSSGFGDGRYPVEGLYGAGQLRGIEIEFIGPAQEKILEAFPALRY